MERDDDNDKSVAKQPEVGEPESRNDTPIPEDADLIDEYGEPLNGEPHEHPRKRAFYKRPAVLIGGAVVLLIVVIVGVRYWL